MDSSLPAGCLAKTARSVYAYPEIRGCWGDIHPLPVCEWSISPMPVVCQDCNSRTINPMPSELKPLMTGENGKAQTAPDATVQLFRPSVNDELIHTKLNIPPMTRLVFRKRLVDSLADAGKRRLAIVYGPAGSGKTSLVRQWLAQVNPMVAWYSLDEADNDFDLFFRYLINCLSFTNRDLKTRLDPILQDRAMLSYQTIVSRLIRILFELDQPIIIVLDDYHYITNIEIHELIYNLISHIGPNAHFVIISRRNIPFSLSHFKVRDQLVEVSAENLKFSEKETRQFFDQILSMPLTTEEIHQLSQCMEGWIGGIQLFGLLIRGHQGKQSFKHALMKARRQSTNYLMDQVIEHLPEPVAQFIFSTALLDRFNADLAKHVSGMNDITGLVEYVLNNNLFLMTLDKQGQWFRYQHLLSEAVRERIRKSNSVLWHKTNCKASLWFARNGYFEDAFRHAFASQDMEFTANLLEAYLLHIYDRCEYASGTRWLAKLPHDIFTQRPLLRLHAVGQEIESFRFTDIDAILKDIEANQASAFDQYQGRKRRLCTDLFTYFSCVMAHYYKDPLNADIERMDAHSSNISDENKILSAYIKIHKALSYMLKAEPVPASQALKDASTIIFSSDTLWPRMIWSRTMATVERMQGRLLRSEVLLQEAVQFLSERNLSNLPLKYMLYLPMGWNYYFRNDLDQSFAYTDAAMKYAEKVKFSRDIIESNLLLALIFQAKGQLDAIEACKRKMVKIANQIDTPYISVDPDLWIARLAISQGDIQSGQYWANQRRLTINDAFSNRFINECLAQAELFLHLQRYQDAVQLMENLRSRCVDRNMLEKVLEIDLLYGAALYATDEQDRALALVKDALAFAATEAYIRPFVNYAKILQPVLSRIKAMKATDAHLNAIWSACDFGSEKTDPVQGAESKAVAELTQRETEILQLMAHGYQYKEIAEKAFISTETVKTHAKHIYEKLKVNSKLQAVRKGRELGLLNRS